LAENAFTLVGKQIRVSEDVIVVTQVWLGVLERAQRAVRVIVLEEIGSAVDLASGSLILQVPHRINVGLKGSFLSVEGVDHIKRLLHEELLNLVDTVLEEFLVHDLVLNVNAVAFHEGHLEPLGAETFLLKVDATGEILHFLRNILLLGLGDVERFAFEIFLPSFKVRVLVLAHWGFVAPVFVMEPKELLVVDNDDIFVVHAETILAESHSFGLLTVAV